MSLLWTERELGTRRISGIPEDDPGVRVGDAYRQTPTTAAERKTRSERNTMIRGIRVPNERSRLSRNGESPR